MLEFVKDFLIFLASAVKVDFLPYIALSLTVVSVLAFVVELVLLLVKAPVKIYVYNLCFSLICLIFELYFAFGDYFNKGLLFANAQILTVYLTLACVKIITFYTVLRLVYGVKIKKSFKKPTAVFDSLEKSKVATYFTKQPLNSDCNGWINVDYLKGLIKELKSKNIAESDYMELEDFEVYLLNFTSRQPNNYERKVLSSRVNSLIKKIARYQTG